MMLLLSVEWMRFRRHRSNLLVVWLLLLLMCASAWFAGDAASAYRQVEKERSAAWESHLANYRNTLPEAPPPESPEAAKKAYEFGRGVAPPAIRPAPGGLALAVQQFYQQPFDVKVSLDSRHLDPRRGAPLGNPLLNSFGVPDFAVVAALLLPLAVIALSYGLVHDPREQGIWPLVRAQTGSPASLVVAGLAVRFWVVFGAASIASALAFSLDPGAAPAEFLIWLGYTCLYTLLWVAIAGLFNLAKLSSAASALGLIAVWLVLNVVLPAGLKEFANQHAPMPVRETTVVEVRDVQHEAEERMATLLDDWYARHPDQRPASVQSHTWPVTYVPKIIWQDRRIATMLMRFDRARTAQASILDPLMWLSPGLALCRAADRLAGADPQQFQRYAENVDALETRWRTVLAPGVMSYRGMTQDDVQATRSLQQKLETAQILKTKAWVGLSMLVVALLLVLTALARRL